MKPILAFTLASLVGAGLPGRLPAPQALSATLIHAGSTEDRKDIKDSLLSPFASVNSSAGRERAASIPMAHIGAAAEKQYSGDGLSMRATESGARLRCAFQKLDGEVTREGLWLTSTFTNAAKDRFRVMASAVGRARVGQSVPAVAHPGEFIAGEFPTIPGRRDAPPYVVLSRTGSVSIGGRIVQLIRPGLIEEYSVSMDGVRQDLIVQAPPGSSGRKSAQTDVPKSENPSNQSRLTSATKRESSELRVEMEVTGAQVEQTVTGARLVLGSSGRKISYSRLRVTDATGRELPARMVVAENSEFRNPKSEMDLAILVNDTGAVYPVRIDPTFSDDNWISMGGFPGANGNVYAAVADGSGNLYIGGSFTIVADVFATNIAKWNGSSWSALGSGMNDQVNALAVSGSDVYAGGYFTTAGGISATNIAKWDGSSWSALGSGTGSASGTPFVYTLAVSGSDLYAGGYFTTAGGTNANYIAKWNGSGWSALGSGMNSYVYALAVLGSNVYAGGLFTAAGGKAATNIAQWDGNNWSALGLGMNDLVNALAVWGSDLYAGGYFTTAGGMSANSIAKWDGSSWSALGSGMEGGYPSSDVSALTVSGGDLYAGGEFRTAGGTNASHIAKWDGSNWSPLGSGMGVDPAIVNALAVSGTNVYAGGSFTTAGGNAAHYIAKWDGSSWSALGLGVGWIDGYGSPSVLALAVSGSDLYAGGTFDTAGGTKARYIAKWNGRAWSALGSGMEFDVHALAVLGTDLYAGGIFTNAGGTVAYKIAKWNGISWSALGSGLGLVVNALAVSGSNLYAGGGFTTAGGTNASHIAKWDGSGWSALGPGLNDNVYALAVSGSNLYAGGWFTMAGGTNANSIAKWDGSSWSALGSGVSGAPFGGYTAVNALAVSGSELYVAGYFTNAGGISANHIAKWNGSTWSALGSGMDDQVNALAMSGSNLYAGGDFTKAGGTNASHIAKWNGGSWSALGLGMNDQVNALVVSGTDLYAGGYFTMAGDKVSTYIARARIGSFANSLAATNSTASIRFSGVTGYQYDVQRAASLNPPITWTTVSTSPLSPASDGSFSFSDTNAPPGMAYYRAVEH